MTVARRALASFLLAAVTALPTLTSVAPAQAASGTPVFITITAESNRVPKDLDFQLSAVVTYSNGETQTATNLVTWRSSNTSVAVISNATAHAGLVRTRSAGSTNITAALGAVLAIQPLTVTNATLVMLSLSPWAPQTISVGAAAQMRALATYSDASQLDRTAYVTWNSSNPLAAAFPTKSAKPGLLLALAPGTTTITAVSEQKNVVSGAVNVTVVPGGEEDDD